MFYRCLYLCRSIPLSAFDFRDSTFHLPLCSVCSKLHVVRCTIYLLRSICCARLSSVRVLHPPILMHSTSTSTSGLPLPVPRLPHPPVPLPVASSYPSTSTSPSLLLLLLALPRSLALPLPVPRCPFLQQRFLFLLLHLILSEFYSRANPASSCGDHASICTHRFTAHPGRCTCACECLVLFELTHLVRLKRDPRANLRASCAEKADDLTGSRSLCMFLHLLLYLRECLCLMSKTEACICV